jgi:hypothetical protein
MNELNIKIDILQDDIQKIINLRSDDKVKNKELDVQKKEKIKLLEMYTKELKNLKEIERKNKKKEKEIKELTNKINNLEYQKHRKKGTIEAKEHLAKINNEREKQITEFNQIREYQIEYDNNDNKDYPGFIFMDSKLISLYGICPFLTKENSDKRQQWLVERDDSGVLYNTIFDKLVRKNILNEYTDKLEEIDNNIKEFINNVLSTSQNELFKKCTSNLDTWVSSKVKTKRIKEIFKQSIDMLSIIVKETDIDIHLYLELKYNMTLVINVLNVKYNVNFKELLNEYKKMTDIIKTENNYIKNTVNNLKEELYKHLIKIDEKEGEIKREGKFFKKWALLKKDERNDRITEYCSYYTDDKEKSERLYNILSSDDIKLYKIIKWNSVKGVIESVKGIIKDDNDNFTIDKKLNIEHNTKTRSKSKKTIFIKENEGIINEVLFKYILNNKEEINNPISEYHYDKIVEIIKLRLQKKKIWGDDKVNIKNRLYEILDIIENNQYP